MKRDSAVVYRQQPQGLKNYMNQKWQNLRDVIPLI